MALPESLSGLRRLIVGGGALSPTLARQALTHLRGGELIYAYGPTECSGLACYHSVVEGEDPGGAIPIGRPASNARVYVLDPSMQPVPVGVRGELWIGGDGLSLGYLNDARLTAERFFPDRFSDDRSRHLFRTGDIVRYRADGTLELFGPADSQVTVRGFRVDAAEVERLLSLYPGVESAAVIARDRGAGDARLIAYFVPHKGAAIRIAEVRAFLRGRLAEYAIPSAFVTLQGFPRKANGTIDHQALPEPAAEDPQSGGSPDGLQTQLLVVWEQVLGISGIGVHDNFFELGGNSFRALNMLAVLEKSIRRRVPIAMLYRGQTVASMAQALREETVDLSVRAVAIQPGGRRPPLFVVPGVSGDVMGYEALARALGPEQPVYVLRSVGLDGEAPPLEDIQSIGASLVTEVQRVQPHGPYHLVGFCMGGIVAYEMAQQLEGRGEKPVLVAMVDTNAPEVLPAGSRRSRIAVKWSFLVRGVSRHVHAMLQQPRGHRLGYIFRKSRILTEMLQQRDIYRGDAHPLYAELVASANQSAAAHYRPVPFNGEVLLILSSEGDPQIPSKDPRLSWRGLARGGSTMTRVEGRDSGSLLKSPNVLSLAEVLTDELDRTGGEADEN